jgi:hypothetical protein
MQKSLDKKLARIAADSSSREFILADAKDVDMALGVTGLGDRRQADGKLVGYRSIQEFQQQIREIVDQQLVDIMLMSASNCDRLARQERLFDDSPVTPAIRANDSTDIWLIGSEANYSRQPSLPFRTAVLEEAMESDGARPFALGRPAVNLGLYSVTLNNDATLDRATLEAYGDFRWEARRLDFRHFLEVFPPNAPVARLDDVPRFVNDSIVRLLAGIGRGSRPLFLKMPYFGPAALEQLVAYDSALVVGILGGSAGTTFDAFQLLWEARKYGARAALFGRKINTADHQLTFIQHLHRIAAGEIEPADAVRSYHADLARLTITPQRALADDLLATPADRGD